jgi:hypothetical protein
MAFNTNETMTTKSNDERSEKCMSAKQVDAQDFVSKLIITQEQGLDEVSALRDFDALLSQARLEAVEEYKQSLTHGN